MSGAKRWVQQMEGLPWPHKLLATTVTCGTDGWCRRSEYTFNRRLTAWRGAAHGSFLGELSDAAGFSREPWRRRRMEALQCRTWWEVRDAHVDHDPRDLLANI